MKNQESNQATKATSTVNSIRNCTINGQAISDQSVSTISFGQYSMFQALYKGLIYKMQELEMIEPDSKIPEDLSQVDTLFFKDWDDYDPDLCRNGGKYLLGNDFYRTEKEDLWDSVHWTSCDITKDCESTATTEEILNTMYYAVQDRIDGRGITISINKYM